MFHNRRAKPALAVFPNPFVATKRGFWGHVRPGAGHRVTLQRKRGRRWSKVASLRTDSRGYWQRRMKKPAGRYRYRWGSGRTSRVIRVG